MSPRASTPASSSPLVKVRTEGIQLVSPLQQAVTGLQVTYPNEDSYAEADFLLARLKSARMTWAAKIAPILNPLKETLAAAKRAMEGTQTLFKEVDGPLALMEQGIKEKMRLYKVEEARQLREAQMDADREAARLREEAERKAQQAASAKTPQMRAKLEQVRADLDAKAATVQAEVAQPTRGAASTVRTAQKPHIADVWAFIAALKDYEPKVGLYQLGHPPLSALTRKINRDGVMVADGSALDAIESELMKIYRQQPGVVASWPGIEIVDDVIIAHH